MLEYQLTEISITGQEHAIGSHGMAKNDLIGRAGQINRDSRDIVSGAGERLRQCRPNIRITE